MIEQRRLSGTGILWGQFRWEAGAGCQQLQAFLRKHRQGCSGYRGIEAVTGEGTATSGEMRPAGAMLRVAGVGGGEEAVVEGAVGVGASQNQFPNKVYV